MGGIATGGTFAPVYDEQKRPITAGGFVDEGPVVFQDITKPSGLSNWYHKMGTPAKKFLIETNGSGVCLIDYDNDGWLDIYLINGSTFDALDGKEAPPHAALFHNNHDGTFTEVTQKAGVANDRWGYGCSVADYDNDGWSDIYVGNYGKNRLYHNNHDGTFTDVAEKAGVALGNWSPGSTWGDYDGDGLLDLYVTGYVHFDRDRLPIPGTNAVGFANCTYRGTTVNCGPRGLPGEPDHLFHNNGNGTFTDVTAQAGVEDKDKLYGFSAIFVDINGDGKPDLVVGNDSEPNYLYINKGDGTFDDQSYVSGFALNKDGREIASMGIAAGDYENNGLIDFYVTDFGDDYKVLFHNDGDASFTDVSYKAGIAQTTIPFVGWGDGFIDYDNDGWLDLFQVDGHVYPEVDQHDWGTTFAERSLLFHNVPEPNGEGRRFDYVPPVKGTGLAEVIPARGAAFGDLFNDGKIDVIINPIDGPPVLLRNVYPDHHHWVEMQLVGGPKGPRDATCATVYLKANGMRMRQDVLSSGSYISSNDRRLHFGLGDANDAGTAEIHWPSGAKEMVKLPAVDRIYTITEGKGITGSLCVGKSCEKPISSMATSPAKIAPILAYRQTIDALAAYADLARLLKRQDIAAGYDATAKTMAKKWITMDAEGNHYKLAFNSPGTWSQKYNLVWDQVLDYNLLPKTVRDSALAFYLGKINRYGLPLDSRADYTKLDWSVWTATLASSAEQFNSIIDPIYRWVNEVPTRVPLTDWYDTKTGKQIGFQARSVVGGVYMKALSDRVLTAKWRAEAASY